jgi:kinesin family protein 11
LFEELIKHVNAQKAEADELRKQLTAASEVAMQANAAASARLDALIADERKQATEDRQSLLLQITSLITAQGETQDARLATKISEIQKDIVSSKETFEASQAKYSAGMDTWNEKETNLVGEVLRSRETLKSKLKEDWVVSKIRMLTDIKTDSAVQAANKHNASLQTATKSVHAETIRIVDEQMKDVSHQMQALDDFVTRARSQNTQHHDIHSKSLQDLLQNVRGSYDNIGTHFTATYDRVKGLGDEMSENTSRLSQSITTLEPTLRQPLAELRSNITMTTLREYEPTGETPQKVQYYYPTELPRTQSHEALLTTLRRPGSAPNSTSSPTKMIPVVFNDSPTKVSTDDATTTMSLHITNTPVAGGLREIDANINTRSLNSGDSTITISSADSQVKVPLLKRSVTGMGIKPAAKGLKKPSVVALEGRENAIPAEFSRSTGRRRSPRT